MIVAAAGRSTRFGGEVPKQFHSLAGVPLLLRALRPFLSHPDVADVVLVLPPEQVSDAPPWLVGLLGERLRAVAGGPERMDSVERGLQALRDGPSVVLVHDGARPFVQTAVIDAVIAEARRGRGAVAAVPVADTLKEAEELGSGRSHPRVTRTVPRSALWRAQTPQGFPRALLERAYAKARAAGFTATDEAALVEHAGDIVVLVQDSTVNLKVTTQGDLRIAEALAQGEHR